MKPSENPPFIVTIPAHARGSVPRIAIWSFAIAVLSSLSGPAARSQTLLQTVAYIETGGFVDVKDTKEIDSNTLYVPTYVVAMTTMMPEHVLKLDDKATCRVTSTTNHPGALAKQLTVHFNNVIVRESRVAETISNPVIRLSKIYLTGEDEVVCWQIEGRPGCTRQWDIPVRTDDVPRMVAAIKHLYSNYCTSAKRKSAF
jgi:hypothetical protein